MAGLGRAAMRATPRQGREAEAGGGVAGHSMIMDVPSADEHSVDSSVRIDSWDSARTQGSCLFHVKQTGGARPNRLLAGSRSRHNP